MLQVTAARGGYGGGRCEKPEFQKKVEQDFKSSKDAAWHVLSLSVYCMVAMTIRFLALLFAFS